MKHAGLQMKAFWSAARVRLTLGLRLVCDCDSSPDVLHAIPQTVDLDA